MRNDFKQKKRGERIAWKDAAAHSSPLNRCKNKRKGRAPLCLFDESVDLAGKHLTFLAKVFDRSLYSDLNSRKYGTVQLFIRAREGCLKPVVAGFDLPTGALTVLVPACGTFVHRS